MEDLSEYTDADESVSAPTEVLAEFLSAIMTKDYANALKHCQLILSYEPDNSTVKEFYPLIIEKLKIVEDDEVDDSSSHSSESDDSAATNTSFGRPNRRRLDSDRTTASYSSLENDDCDVSCISDTDIRNGNANVHYMMSDLSLGKDDNSNKDKEENFIKTIKTNLKNLNQNPKSLSSASDSMGTDSEKKSTNWKPVKTLTSSHPERNGNSTSGSSFFVTGKPKTKSPIKTSGKSKTSSIG